jgi:poly [ADP-ribose] polymerase
LSEYVNKGDFGASKYLNLISDYLRLIPQNVGMKIHPESLYPDLNAIQKQNSILDSLQASLDQLTAVGQKAKANVVKGDAARVFNVKLELIEDSREVDRIRRKYKSTLNSGHSCSHLDVQKVYGVNIPSMRDAFESDGRKMENVEPGKIKELWHGSKCSNLLSILAKGLIIPPANASFCTGRLMGAGAYFSDQSTKSLNYSYGYWSGGSRDNHCFMFLADVGLGKWYIPNGGGTFEKQYREGYNSIFAKAGRSGVINNEFVVPRVSQCNLTRLIEFGT